MCRLLQMTFCLHGLASLYRGAAAERNAGRRQQRWQRRLAGEVDGALVSSTGGTGACTRVLLCMRLPSSVLEGIAQCTVQIRVKRGWLPA